MIKKLLIFSAITPMTLFAQSAHPEQLAKQAAAQMVQPVALTTNAILDCDVAQLPYSENFNSVTVPNIPTCSVIENAGAGNDFTTASSPGYGFNSNVLRYQWNVDNPANAWWFTPGFQMTAGQTYVLSYKYGSAGASLYTEKLKVHVGTAQESVAMFPEPLIDHPLVNNNVTPITDNLNFTPEEDGIYFFGFNCYSNPDQFYLFIDDVTVTQSLAVSEQNQLRFSVYPNPAADVVTISSAEQITNLTVMDLSGKTVLKSDASANEIQLGLGQLQSGMYFLKVESAGSSGIRKIVKN